MKMMSQCRCWLQETVKQKCFNRLYEKGQILDDLTKVLACIAEQSMNRIDELLP